MVSQRAHEVIIEHPRCWLLPLLLLLPLLALLLLLLPGIHIIQP